MAADIFLQSPWRSWPAGVVATILIAAAAHEFYAMARQGGAEPFTLLGVAGTALAFILPWLARRAGQPIPFDGLLAATLLLAFVGLGARFRKGTPEALRDAAVTLFGKDGKVIWRAP